MIRPNVKEVDRNAGDDAVIRLRSSSSIFCVREIGPSPMSTTPPRPTARYTASCVFGLRAMGISLPVQPRGSELFSTAPTAPGFPSICP